MRVGDAGSPRGYKAVMIYLIMRTKMTSSLQLVSKYCMSESNSISETVNLVLQSFVVGLYQPIVI